MVDLSRHAFSFLLNGPKLGPGRTSCCSVPCSRHGDGTANVVAGRRGTAAAVLAGLLGAGQVVAGLFAPDGAYGYPPGAPDGMPSDLCRQPRPRPRLRGLDDVLARPPGVGLGLRTEHRRWAIGCALTAGRSWWWQVCPVIPTPRSPSTRSSPRLRLHLGTPGAPPVRESPRRSVGRLARAAREPSSSSARHHHPPLTHREEPPTWERSPPTR